MTPNEEIALVQASILEYIKLNSLDADDLIDIFNAGADTFAYPELVSPLLEIYKSKVVPFKEVSVEVRISTLKFQKDELEDTLKYLPSSEKARQDKILDKILKINQALAKYQQAVDNETS